MKMKIITLATPAEYDHTEITFEVDGRIGGSGFIGKGKDQRLGLIKCPVCQKENYAVSVSSGVCVFCDFNANAGE
ncbi:MAG: hypothetical protein Q7K65_04855 [Candidatus Buchananbacteria bacterium]|nr:hypothetical protein [Candidatus Buchananbacteria bacterium]